jgi:hypothetical protein
VTDQSKITTQAKPGDDADFPSRQQRFLANVERMTRAANREIIHKHMSAVTPDDVTRLAVLVAELRARYLKAAMRLVERESGVAPDSGEMAQLSRAREMYDEAVHAFEAMRRAIERGYVNIAD